MHRTALYCTTFFFMMANTAWAEGSGDKVLGGMSIVGNDDAPKSLIIVPWKSSSLGDALDIARHLDDGRQPVDRDVFMRELSYYEIRSGSSSGDGPASQ
jgi:hypothetical protein